MHQQALKRHQTPTVIFSRIQNHFILLKSITNILYWHPITSTTTPNKI